MTFVALAAFVGAALDFVVFMVGAKLYFDLSKVEKTSRLFVCGYCVTICVALGFQFGHPAPDFRRQAAALALEALSLVLFFSAAQANRKAPLTAIFSKDAPAQIVRHGPYR